MAVLDRETLPCGGFNTRAAVVYDYIRPMVRVRMALVIALPLALAVWLWVGHVLRPYWGWVSGGATFAVAFVIVAVWGQRIARYRIPKKPVTQLRLVLRWMFFLSIAPFALLATYIVLSWGGWGSEGPRPIPLLTLEGAWMWPTAVAIVASWVLAGRWAFKSTVLYRHRRSPEDHQPRNPSELS